MDAMQSWYVIHSKPRKENQVYSQLCARSIEVFYPTIRVKPVNPRSSKIRPYFPGYLFAYVDLEAIGVGALQWLPGVNRVVQFDGCPASVPDNFISELEKHITTINNAGPIDLNRFKKGDPVKITEGPLTGHEAIFDMRLSAKDRIRVILEVVGRLVRADIDAGTIEHKLPKKRTQNL